MLRLKVIWGPNQRGLVKVHGECMKSSHVSKEGVNGPCAGKARELRVTLAGVGAGSEGVQKAALSLSESPTRY